jgi:hypothetical protein
MSRVLTIKMPKENEFTKPKLIKAAKKLKFKSVNEMLVNLVNNLIK